MQGGRSRFWIGGAGRNLNEAIFILNEALVFCLEQLSQRFSRVFDWGGQIFFLHFIFGKVITKSLSLPQAGNFLEDHIYYEIIQSKWSYCWKFLTSNMEKKCDEACHRRRKIWTKRSFDNKYIPQFINICPYPPNNCFFDTALGLWGLFL